MYVPASFAQTDLTKLHDFIDAHSFGLLVTHATTLAASHLPFLLDRERGEQGTIIGHMARANDQWQEADGTSALVVFRGPHAYITPAWYEAANVVPTWNYAAVHATGTLKVIHEHERLRQIVSDTVTQYESPRAQPWTLDSVSDEVMDGLVKAIVGFEVEIEIVEGKWKLNQNHDAERRQRVIDGLHADGGVAATEVAALMEATLSNHRNAE